MFPKRTVAFLFVLTLLILSCGSKQDKNVLIIGIPADTDSFNPLLVRSRFGTELSKMLYTSLVTEDIDLYNFKPALARSWEPLDDQTRLRFHLRTDVFWSDNTRVTARDVAFSHQLYTDESLQWVGGSVKDRIHKVTVVNDSTIDFYFTQDYPYQMMDVNEGVILPRHILYGKSIDELKDFDFTSQSVASGPFVLKNYIPNQYIELSENPLYYEPQYPVIKQIVFKIVPDKTLLMTQLQTGEIQFIEGIPPEQAEMLSNPEIHVQSFPYAQFMQISWNTTLDIFSNPEIRRALTMSIDRQVLVDHLLKGYGKVCKGPIHPMLWAYNHDLQTLPFSPTKAATILEQLGWADSDQNGYLDKDGQELAFKVMTNIGSQVREDALVMIQEMLRKNGIRVIPERLEWAVYVEKLVNRDFDGILLGMMSASKVDVFQVWHSSMTGNEGFNLSCYENKRLDEIIETAPEMPKEQALPLWYEFQDILVREQPATFLWVPDRIAGMDSHLAGYVFSPVSTFYNVHQWYWN